MEKLKKKIQKACIQEISRIYGEMIQTSQSTCGKNQQSLADLLDLKQSTISRYESGKNSIPIAKLMILEEYLNINETNYWNKHEERYVYLTSLRSLYLAAHASDNLNQLVALIEEINIQHKTRLIRSPWLQLVNVKNYCIKRICDEEGAQMMEYSILIGIISLTVIVIMKLMGL